VRRAAAAQEIGRRRMDRCAVTLDGKSWSTGMVGGLVCCCLVPFFLFLFFFFFFCSELLVALRSVSPSNSSSEGSSARASTWDTRGREQRSTRFNRLSHQPDGHANNRESSISWSNLVQHVLHFIGGYHFPISVHICDEITALYQNCIQAKKR